LALILACIGNLLHVYFAEQQVGAEIRNAGGNYETSLFGFMPDDSPNGWDDGPRLLRRIVLVRLSGSDIDDEKIARLQLHRFKHLRSLSIGYEAVLGVDGPKWEDLAAPVTDKGLLSLPAFDKLRYLNLRDLPIGDVGLRGISEKYPSVEQFDLQGTLMTDVAMPEIGRIDGLMLLLIDDTSVTDAGLVHLGQLKDMRVLSMNNTRVAGSGLHHLAGLSKLHTLKLRATGVSDDDVHHLTRLTRLRSLGLNGTRVSDDGVGCLASLTELEYLELGNTAVTDAGVKCLVRLPRLSGLELTGTLVTDQGLFELAKMPSLNHVSIDNVGVTKTGIDDFLSRKANRSVVYDNQVIYGEERPIELD